MWQPCIYTSSPNTNIPRDTSAVTRQSAISLYIKATITQCKLQINYKNEFKFKSLSIPRLNRFFEWRTNVEDKDHSW